MKVLWAVSNWKHTGPVQPSLDLAAALAGRGHDVRVEVGVPPAAYRPEAEVMRDERGLLRADVGARLHKHAFFLRDLPDVARLAAWMRRERPDAAVATLANDHRLLLAAARRAGSLPVVRLLFADGAREIPARERRALAATEHVVVFGEAPRAQLLGLGLGDERIHRLGAPLDVERLRAAAPDGAAARARLGIPAGHFLLGIVARLQRHRRYDLLWESVAELARRAVPVHVLVLGRGTYAEAVGHGPVRALGIEDRVTFGGYHQGLEYLERLAAFDAQLLLVPGSDPTCRALREGMALGVPSVATRRGLLSSIVVDGETGLLVEETAEDLARAVQRLAGDREATRRMGEAAARRAVDAFAADRVAADLEAVLRRAVGT